MQNMLSNNNDLLDCRSLCGYSFENVHSEVNSIQLLLLPRILEIYTSSILGQELKERKHHYITAQNPSFKC